MSIVKASKQPIDSSDPGVQSLRLVTSANGAKTMTAGVATFEPGAVILWHTHPCEETVIIVEGNATAHIDDQKIPLEQYDTTIMPPNIPHRFSNDSDQPMTIAYFYPMGNAPRIPYEKKGV